MLLVGLELDTWNRVLYLKISLDRERELGSDALKMAAKKIWRKPIEPTPGYVSPKVFKKSVMHHCIKEKWRIIKRKTYPEPMRLRKHPKIKLKTTQSFWASWRPTKYF
jgi:hypothetical protein